MYFEVQITPHVYILQYFEGKSVTMVGSSAEGYKIPPILNRGVPSLQTVTHQDKMADIDVLMAWDIKPFQEYNPSSETKQTIILETYETYPGYSRVLINDPDKVMQGVDPNLAVTVNNKLYLSAKTQRVNANMILEEEVNNTNYKVDQTGPATALEDPMEYTLKFFKSGKEVIGRQEMVPALPCKWPSIANGWIKRERNNDWLDSSLIDDIVMQGCHVVPVPHRFSANPDAEWRVSFATSEVKLANTVVTEEQRHCYVCLKLLRKQLVTTVEKKSLNFLTSYQCKTIFLYSCEKLPVLAWKDNTSSCFLYMIDMLLACFRKKCLPSFFIPENNLIHHFSEEESKNVETVLQTARYNPIEPLLVFCDTRIMPGHGTASPFRNSINGVLGDLNAFKTHRNIQRSLVEFFQAQYMLMSSLLLDNNIEMAVANTFDIFQFYESYFPEQDIAGFIAMTMLKWKLVMQLVQVFETAILYSIQYPSLKKFGGYIACLYHAASLNFTPGLEHHVAAIQKSEYWFNRIIDEDGIQTPAAVDYAIMLLKIGNMKKAEQILRSFLSSCEVKKSDMVNKYTHITYCTLEDSLRNELQEIVKTSLVVTLPTVALAHFILLKCLLQCRSGYEEEVTKFMDHCKTESEDWPYFLLGLFFLALEKYDDAQVSFLKSISINPAQPIAGTKVHTSKVQNMITLGEEKEAVQYLLETATRKYNHLPIVGFLDFIALSLGKPSHAIKIYEVLVDLSEGNPAYLNLRGNLSCMFHASAYDYEENSDEYILAMAQADTLFSTSISASEDMKIATVVDYSLFLIGQERWREAEKLICTIIPAKIAATSTNSYGPIEYNTLDANLKKEVDIMGRFVIGSVALAYYCLIKCIYNIHSTGKEFNKVISDFDNYCKKKKDSRSLSLLGYAYMLNSWWSEAEDCFCKAVELSWDYTAAKRNMMDCRLNAEALGFPSRELRTIYSPLCVIPELAGDFTLDYDKILTDV